MLLRERCQRQNLVGEHSIRALLRARWERGTSVRRRLRGVWRLFVDCGIGPGISDGSGGRAPPRERLGEPSRFAVGSWVRVRPAEEIRATLDAQVRLRGLVFVPQQFGFCDGIYRVARRVCRLLDDHGAMRPIARTVLLDGVTCAGTSGDAGCGRACPLMFRDEWLAPSTAPRHDEADRADDTRRRFVRVRSAAAIHATLDPFGRRDGLLFMPEMDRFTGQRFAVDRELTQVFECDRWLPPRRPIHLLEGLRCSGAALGTDGPCDRACALLWHADWLEPAP